MFNKNTLFFLFLLFSSLVAVNGYAEELTGKQIIDKASDRNKIGFESGRAQISLDIVDSKGTKLNRKLDIKSKKVSGKNRTLVTILAPADLQNQAFLFVQNANDKNDIWMYLPAFKLTRRVEGSQKDASFLGSHFTYADLQGEETSGTTYKRLPDSTIGKTKVYVVQSTPKSGSSVYSRVDLFIRQSDFIPLKTVFYVKGAVKKTLFITKIAKTKSNSSYAKQLVLKVPDGGKTTISVNAVDETDIPDSVFSKEQLGK